MESTFSLSSELIALSAAPPLIAATLLSVCVLVARGRGMAVGLVPSYVAAAATAPTLAVFLAVRHTIRAFEEMASRGGGIGSAAAGMWEATQPLYYSLICAGLMFVVPLVLAFRATASAEPSGGDRKRLGRLIAVLIVVFSLGGVTITSFMFLNVTKLILGIIDPQAAQLIPVSEVSQLIASRLLITAGAAVLTFLVLAASSVVGLFFGVSARGAGSRVTKLLLGLVVLGLLVIALLVRENNSLAKTLYQTALTGRVPQHTPN